MDTLGTRPVGVIIANPEERLFWLSFGKGNPIRDVVQEGRRLDPGESLEYTETWHELVHGKERYSLPALPGEYEVQGIFGVQGLRVLEAPGQPDPKRASDDQSQPPLAWSGTDQVPTLSGPVKLTVAPEPE